MKRLLHAALVLGLLVLLLGIGMRLRYGGPLSPFPDRTTKPLLPDARFEVVATLDVAPGNLAVAPDGRVLFSYHPEGRPSIKVVELHGDKPVPFPGPEWQSPRGAGEPYFDCVLGVRIDRQNRLWTIDHGFHGLRTPRLLAFDLKTRELVHRYDFPREVAGVGSYVQDFQVDPEGRYLYIADLGMLNKRPALIVYDAVTHTARRRLERHSSVTDKPYLISAKGRPLILLGGLFNMHPAVDSIALDKKGEWLYYGPMSHEDLFRVRAADLRDPGLADSELQRRVENYGPKVQSDGITIDSEDNVYLSDVEHGAIAILDPARKLHTLAIDRRVRWPDGFSFGPAGYLYFTDSSLSDLSMQTKSHMQQSAPYYIFRLQTGKPSIPGQ